MSLVPKSSALAARSGFIPRLQHIVGLMLVLVCGTLLYGEPVYWAFMDRHAQPRIETARSWCYQLIALDQRALKRADCDVLVTYPLDGGKQALREADTGLLKRNTGGRRRIVLAYLSVGEAEAYREYWKSEWLNAPPWWLGGRNPSWRGAYRVRFWAEDWQAMLFGSASSLVSGIIKAGFDGVFLDTVDVYDVFSVEEPRASQLMVELVTKLSREAKMAKPGFLIVPQNGEELLSVPRYRDAIDAVAKEDLIYGLAGDGEKNGEPDVIHSMGLLRQLKARGKPVFVVEYLSDQTRIAAANTVIRREGFIPAFAMRLLDGAPRTGDPGEGQAAGGQEAGTGPDDLR